MVGSLAAEVVHEGDPRVHEVPRPDVVAHPQSIGSGVRERLLHDPLRGVDTVGNADDRERPRGRRINVVVALDCSES